jgi:two-component system response regulator YesN
MEKLHIPVLIVDDEYLIRSLIWNAVAWEDLGFQIVGEAEDGEQALQLIEQFKPRLLIVDINIPFLNGIELSIQVHLRYPYIKIIILTGYEEFQYAQKAIQAGVLNYLLKPLNTEEFQKSLEQAKDLILEEEKNKFLTLHTRTSKGKEVGILREQFLRSLLLSGTSFTNSEVEESLRMYHIHLPKCFVLGILDGNPIKELFSFPSWDKEAIFFYDDSGRVVLLFLNERDIPMRESHALVNTGIEKGVELTIGLSRGHSGSSKLPDAYQEALHALEHKFYEGTGRVFLYQPDPSPSKKWKGSPNVLDKNTMVMGLRAGNSRLIEELLTRLFDWITEKKPPREYCELICVEIFAVLYEFLDEQGIPPQTYFNEMDILEELRIRDTFESLKAWMFQTVLETCSKKEMRSSKRTQLVVQKARQFIEKNFSKKYLSVEHVAEHVSVTANYLSGVFKRELQVSVIEYLTQCRLKKAKELMEAEPLLSIGEIADRVGYMDPYYFSKCFRKQYGIAPSHYIRNRLGT